MGVWSVRLSRELSGLALITATACASGGANVPERDCRLTFAQRNWIEGSLASWEQVRARALRLPEGPPPLLIFFDRRCTYTFARSRPGVTAARYVDRVRLGADTLTSVAGEHHGTLALPNGKTIPAWPATFASLLPGDSATFLVMALEDVWSNHPSTATDPENWSSYLRRVLVHEMTHSRQLETWAPVLRVAGGRVGLDDLNDDIIQHQFDSIPEFRAAVLIETELLYRAAFAHPAEQRRLIREALDSMRRRRARAYGANAAWADIEQLFLDMEGAAQWAALAHLQLAAPRISTRANIRVIRESRTFWSQDQGLALYLALAALVPDWQRDLFSANPRSALELLQRALDGTL